ncbi:VOC family protein, partial [Rhodospirillaceae bacterium]|nr:VOC family protein [Rhodospirillaceae bacterium]
MAALLIEADIRTKIRKGNKVTRGIDHVVIAVNDMKKAREIYAKMGFKVTPKALHPFGTENSLVQFNGNFIEIVSINNISLVPPHTREQYSFAQANVDFLSFKEGMSSLVFQSLDARRDREEFLASGLHTYKNVDFERKAKLPDGTSVIVGFSLAFLTNPVTPNMTFFCCQQHAP